MAKAEKIVETTVIVKGVTLELSVDEAEALHALLSVCSLATPVKEINSALSNAIGLEHEDAKWKIFKGANTDIETNRITLINMKRK